MATIENVVIDDLRTFNFDAVYFRNSADALESLKIFCAAEISIEHLWLDHDLGYSLIEKTITPGKDTIMPVIDWLAEKAFDVDQLPQPQIANIYVHTSNPAGGDTMMRVLKRWKYNVKRVLSVSSMLA